MRPRGQRCTLFSGGEVGDRLRELLPDGVFDELLAGARSEEEIVGPGGLSRS
jgi:hypothetical protein